MSEQMPEDSNGLKPASKVDFVDSLQRLKERVINELPERIAHVNGLIERITADHYSTKNTPSGSWPPSDFDDLQLSLHKLAGLVGSFGLHDESIRFRDLLDHVEHWRNTDIQPRKQEWLRFAQLAASTSQTEHRAITAEPDPDDNSVNVAPGQGIWLIDDDDQQAGMLRTWLESQGYQVRVFLDVEQFSVAYAQLPKADVILMDMCFEESRFAGAEQIARLRAQYGNLPPVVFISVLNDLPARLMALRAGATRYLVKPLHRAQVTRLVDELSGAVPPTPYRVLLVDDDAYQLEVSSLQLQQAGFNVSTLAEPMRMLEELQRFQPDVVVLDIYMPDVSGPELAAILREDSRYDFLPIIFLSAEADPSKRLLALGMGGDDYLIKPVNPVHLVASVRARAKRARKLASTVANTSERNMDADSE